MNEDILDTLDVINNRLVTIETKLEDRIENTDEKEMIDSLVSNCRELVVNCRTLNSETNIFRGNFKKLLDMMNENNKRLEDEIKWYRDKVDSSLKLGYQNEEKLMKDFKSQFSNKWIEFKNKFVKDFFLLVGFACTVLCLCSFSLGAVITRRINGWYLDTVFEQFYEDKFYSELEKPMAKAESETAAYLKKKKSEADEYLKNQMIQAREQADAEYRKRMEAYASNAVKQVNKEVKKGGNKNAVESTETE